MNRQTEDKPMRPLTAKDYPECPNCGRRMEKYTLDGVKSGFYCPACRPEWKEAHDQKYAKMRAGLRKKRTLDKLNEIYEQEMSQ